MADPSAPMKQTLREVATLLRLAATDFEDVAEGLETMPMGEVLARIKHTADASADAINTLFGTSE